MNADLRNALHDLAEGQEFRPGPDAWDRGRRARRRSRIVAGAAALGVVAVVAGVGALVTGTPAGLAPAERDVVPGGAIPSRIEDISDDVESTSEPAVGRASAAFRSTHGPVVITAADGVPHLMELPGWSVGDEILALSPNGERLAWQSGSAAVGTQVTILDLVGGSWVRHEISEDSLHLRNLSWSPDSTWLAFAGAENGGIVGRVDPFEGTVLVFDPPTWAIQYMIDSVSVSNDGDVVAERFGDGIHLMADKTSSRRLTTEDLGVGAFSPDGRYLALRSAPDSSTYTLDMESRTVLEHPFPADTIPTAVSRPLGWLDNRLQLLLVTPTDGADAELVVTTPQVDEQSTWRRRVGSVDPDVADTLSLAVDLVPDLDGSSSQQLTHDFGEPEGTGERDISWMIGLGVAAAIAVLMGARRLWRWSRDRGL